jgi:signal peptidase I
MKDFKDFKKKWKAFWKKFWFLLWKDDSLKGWIFSIVFLLIFIKLIFFPGLSLLTGTELPLAIVESCSMYHKGNLLSNYDSWWERHEEKYTGLELTSEQFEAFSFKNGFNKGDILFIVGTSPEKLKIGDVIIFQGNQKNPIIHRIIDIKKINNELVFSTIGDNNAGQLSAEKEIYSDQIIGRAVFRLAPYIGWGKLIFFELGRLPSDRGLCSEN